MEHLLGGPVDSRSIVLMLATIVTIVAMPITAMVLTSIDRVR